MDDQITAARLQNKKKIKSKAKAGHTLSPTYGDL